MRKGYAGAAVQTELTAPIGAAATSFTVAEATGWAFGGRPFVVVIDRGVEVEEKVLCSAISGTTVTVAEGGRGYDGTTAVAHEAGASTMHVLDATTMADLWEQVSQAVGGITPVGGIIMWSGTVDSIPTGWALCDGTNGTPNLRGRFIVGAGGTYAVGATGGAETVALLEANLPAHTHGMAHTHDISHTHTMAHTHSTAHTHTMAHTHSGPSHRHTETDHSHGSGTLATSAESHTHGLASNLNTQAGTDRMQGSSNPGSGNFTYTSNSDSHSHSISGSTSSSSANYTGYDGTGTTSGSSASSTGAASSATSGASSAASTGAASSSTSGASSAASTGSTGSGTAHENRPPYFALAYIMRVA